MKLVKLPSGKYINADHIVKATYLPSRPFKGKDHDEPTQLPSSLRVEWSTQLEYTDFKGPDADELNEWLDLNSEDAVGLLELRQTSKR
jgi:hypothetical protein